MSNNQSESKLTRAEQTELTTLQQQEPEAELKRLEDLRKSSKGHMTDSERIQLSEYRVKLQRLGELEKKSEGKTSKK